MQELSGAFNRAMVLESLPEELKASDIGTEVLMAFATTVAYKVFHNLGNGHKMDPNFDPITVDGVPAREVWEENYHRRRCTCEKCILKN